MFQDRIDAGRRLAARLAPWRGEAPVVLALPRGGLPVAAEIAEALGAPLDLLVARKVAAPWHPELALGAVAEGDPPVVVWNDDVLAMMGVSQTQRQDALDQALAELERRREAYLAGRPRLPLGGRSVILADDGVATGATARAAARSVRAAGASRLILALPVAPPETLEALRAEADEVVCLQTPSYFPGVGAFYRAFPQLADRDVAAILGHFPPPDALKAPGPDRPARP